MAKHHHAIDGDDCRRTDSRFARSLRCYATLTKARLSSLVLATTAVGFVLAAETTPAPFDVWIGLWTMLGTALAAAAANTLNQVLEIPRDRLMQRTRSRPLPTGAMSARRATVIGLGLGATGVAILATTVNMATAGLALLTIVLYVLAYTPLKPRSSLNTLVGAVCGAIPPMIGWVAVTGRADAGAWALGGLLFVWQIPHFLALAWLYREDYANARFAMLPVFDRTGRLTGQIVVLTSLMLIPIALTVSMLGLAGWTFTLGSIVLGVWLSARGVRLYRERSDANARRVFLGSLMYLTAIVLLLVIDRGPMGDLAPDVVHRLALGSEAARLLPATP